VKTFQIRKEFRNGELRFIWTKVSGIDNSVQLKRNGKTVKFRENGQNVTWQRITNDEYTVEGFWKYQSVEITVVEYTSSFQSNSHSSYKLTGRLYNKIDIFCGNNSLN
jgi:hypothetical protein